MESRTTESKERGRITVVVEDERDLPPSGADVRARVSGASFVGGGAALKSAREIASMVHALGSGGVASEDVHVEGVSARVESGLLTKSSSAVYELRVRVSDPTKLGAVLGVLASTPNTSLSGVEWRYPAQPPFADAWSAELATRARARATKIAEAVGQGIGALLGFDETYAPSADGHRPMAPGMAYGSMQRAGGGAPALETGAELTHVQRVRLRVTATFEVEPAA